MKFTPNDPPRVFEVGFGPKIQLKDCGRLELAPDEQVTVVTEAHNEYDVARKDWGFYATPSLNGRLLQHNLRACLIKNRVTNRFFVLLVEKGHEDQFRRYMEKEKLDTVCWLDTEVALETLESRMKTEHPTPDPFVCPLCGSSKGVMVHQYHQPPEGETRFDFSSSGSYDREITQCTVCGHYVSLHAMDMTALYQSDYVSSTYGPDGLQKAFECINALPPERSDNTGRVKRIVDFAQDRWPQRDGSPTLLDVGSGLGVFPCRIQAMGWTCTALDPDPRAVAHLQQKGIEAICGQLNALGTGLCYDVITFNKVLEHVADPVQLLSQSMAHLKPGGFIYVELPDGEDAVSEGFDREEFFIEHHHIFSFVSVALLAKQAGYQPILIERLREPSTKFTLRAFLQTQHDFGGLKKR